MRPADAGDFVCQVSIAADAIIEVTHTMEVLGERQLKNVTSTYISTINCSEFICMLKWLHCQYSSHHSFSVPPRVRAQPLDGNIVVKKGSQVTLECAASGNPVPNVVWSREVGWLRAESLTSQEWHLVVVLYGELFS